MFKFNAKSGEQVHVKRQIPTSNITNVRKVTTNDDNDNQEGEYF